MFGEKFVLLNKGCLVKKIVKNKLGKKIFVQKLFSLKQNRQNKIIFVKTYFDKNVLKKPLHKFILDKKCVGLFFS